MTAGRPTAFKAEYVEEARKLCLLGATDVEMADFFGVAVSTFYLWKNKHPEFSEALKAGKEAADSRVERSLYHKAIGYTFESEKVFQHQGDVVRAPIREHVPPDTTAAIFWLKNRRPEEWRDRVIAEHSGPDGGPIQHEDVSMTEAARRIAFALARAGRATKEPGNG
jgi:hypothetical protein